MNINVQNSFSRVGIGVFLVFAMMAVSMIPVAFLLPEAQANPATGYPLYSWGMNTHGQLGLGNSGANTDRDTPHRVGTAENWVALASAFNSSAAINADGQLFVWGADRSTPQMGQGGTGTENIDVPTRVGTASNWNLVAARSQVIAAVNTQGHLFTWGQGGQGQLGHGDTNNRSVPTRVGTATNWSQVAVGGALADGFMIGLRTNGHLYSWGNNTVGQLGRGPGPNSSTPQRVGTATNWVHVATGVNFALAINNQGEIYTWGHNANGQLGLGDNNGRSVPTRINFAGSWVDVETANTSVAAITADGRLFSWGDNANGQLGRPVNVANPATAPRQVGTASNWVAIMGGNAHYLAFNELDELYTWGNNSNGQLGLGDTVNRSTPVRILRSYGFGDAGRGGGAHSLMLLRTTPIQEDLFLTKDLQKPTGTPVPNLTFSFTFTPHSFNDNTTNLTPLPTIPTRTVTINSSNTSTPNSPSAGIITTRNTVDVLAGITFTQPGVYAWTVAEVQSATGIGNLSTVTFSQATYRLRVYVTQASVGAPLEIHSITIHRLTNTAGAPVNPPLKVPNLVFDNIYIRTTTGDNDYPGALTLSKTVTGQFAVLTTPFDFHVTLTRTALCPPPTNFVGRVMQGNTQIGADIAFASGVQQTVTLTHGQRLVFDELVVGTHFTATELPALEFRASVVLFVNGQAVTVAPNTLPNLALPIGSHLIGVERNTADFTNAHAYLPPTGLGIGNYTTLLLPAVALLIVSLIALRARKRIEELSLIS